MRIQAEMLANAESDAARRAYAWASIAITRAMPLDRAGYVRAKEAALASATEIADAPTAASVHWRLIQLSLRRRVMSIADGTLPRRSKRQPCERWRYPRSRGRMPSAASTTRSSTGDLLSNLPKNRVSRMEHASFFFCEPKTFGLNNSRPLFFFRRLSYFAGGPSIGRVIN